MTTLNPASGNRLDSHLFNFNIVKYFCICFIVSKKNIFIGETETVSHPDSGCLFKWLVVEDVKHFFESGENQDNYERIECI